MSEKPHPRGQRGGRGQAHRAGGSAGRTAGGGTGGIGNHGTGASSSRAEKKNILDLAKYMNTRVMVKFAGGRQVSGLLKGHDPLLNLVLEDAEETFDAREMASRKLGLVVVRGPSLILLSPVEGSEEIENPFMAPDEEEES